MVELSSDPVLRALFAIFGQFDLSGPYEETPWGSARFLAVNAQKLFKDFSEKANKIEISHPKPSPDRLPKLREVLSRFEEDLRVNEGRFDVQVKQPRDLLQKEVYKVAIIGTSDAGQVQRQCSELEWLERQPLNYLERGQLVIKAIQEGQELIYLAVMGCSKARRDALFGEQQVGSISLVQQMRDIWLNTKTDKSKKAELSKLNVMIAQVTEMFDKMRGEAQARCEMTQSFEDAMRARLQKQQTEDDQEEDK